MKYRALYSHKHISLRFKKVYHIFKHTLYYFIFDIISCVITI